MSAGIQDTTGANMGSGKRRHCRDCGRQTPHLMKDDGRYVCRRCGTALNPCDTEAAIEAIQRPNQWTGETVEKTDAMTGETVTFERSEPTTNQWLPKMDLPGYGSEGDDCGEDVVQFCECCGHSWTVGHTCKSPTCRRCAESWCRERATQITSKLKAVWAYRMASEPEHQFFQHLVFDIPDDWKLSDSPETVYWRTLDAVKEVMDAFGIAGVPIYHPYRGADGDDRDVWKDRQFSGRGWEDVSAELEFDPHFHILGVAPFVDCSGVERIQEVTGWPIHRITQGDNSSISVGSDWDLARTVAYCLSHAGVYEDSNGDMRAAAHTRVSERPWRKNGWLDGTIPTIQDRTRDEMDEIVRSVAPKVLGTEYSEVACLREVPADEAAAGNMSLAKGVTEFEATGDGDGDGSADGSDDDRADDGDELVMVKCEGRALHISKAPQYLNDDDWRESVDKAPEIEQKYEEYCRNRGIPV